MVMTKRAALYARTSTDKNQSVENQLRQLNEVPFVSGGRLWPCSRTKVSRARRAGIVVLATTPC